MYKSRVYKIWTAAASGADADVLVWLDVHMKLLRGGPPSTIPNIVESYTVYMPITYHKSQIISKGLFGILGFFQKTNEQIRF